MCAFPRRSSQPVRLTPAVWRAVYAMKVLTRASLPLPVLRNVVALRTRVSAITVASAVFFQLMTLISYPFTPNLPMVLYLK